MEGFREDGLSLLVAMFGAAVEPAVVEDVLAAHGGHLDEAIESLLALADPARVPAAGAVGERASAVASTGSAAAASAGAAGHLAAGAAARRQQQLRDSRPYPADEDDDDVDPFEEAANEMYEWMSEMWQLAVDGAAWFDAPPARAAAPALSAATVELDPETARSEGVQLFSDARWVEDAACCRVVLHSLPEAHRALSALDAYADHFNRQYDDGLVQARPEDRLKVWRIRIAHICELVVQEALLGGGRLVVCTTDATYLDALHLAVQQCLLAQVHQKVFSAVQHLYRRTDEELAGTIVSLQSCDLEGIGVHPAHVRAATGQAVMARFEQLEQLRSPIEMASCIRDTLRLLADGAQRMQQEAGPSEFGGAMPSADDLLTLVIAMLLRARPFGLVSTATYVDFFLCVHSPTSHKGELGFSLANFLAGCEYLRSDDVRRLQSGKIATSYSAPVRPEPAPPSPPKPVSPATVQAVSDDDPPPAGSVDLPDLVVPRPVNKHPLGEM